MSASSGRARLRAVAIAACAGERAVERGDRRAQEAAPVRPGPAHRHAELELHRFDAPGAPPTRRGAAGSAGAARAAKELQEVVRVARRVALAERRRRCPPRRSATAGRRGARRRTAGETVSASAQACAPAASASAWPMPMSHFGWITFHPCTNRSSARAMAGRECRSTSVSMRARNHGACAVTWEMRLRSSRLRSSAGLTIRAASSASASSSARSAVYRSFTLRYATRAAAPAGTGGCGIAPAAVRCDDQHGAVAAPPAAPVRARRRRSYAPWLAPFAAERPCVPAERSAGATIRQWRLRNPFAVAVGKMPQSCAGEK